MVFLIFPMGVLDNAENSKLDVDHSKDKNLMTGCIQISSVHWFTCSDGTVGP